MSLNRRNKGTDLGKLRQDTLGVIGIDLGLVEGMTQQTITGFNPVLSNGVTDSLDASTLAFGVTFPASAGTLSITSDNVNDTATGTGLNSLLLVGLDSDYNVLQELIVMDGTTPVLTASSDWLRVNTILSFTSGNGANNDATNIGTIYVSFSGEVYTTPGEPDTIMYCLVEPTIGISRHGVFTVPANNSFVFNRVNISTVGTSANPVIHYNRSRFFGQVWITPQQVQVIGGFGGFHINHYGTYFAKTDIQFFGYDQNDNWGGAPCLAQISGVLYNADNRKV